MTPTAILFDFDGVIADSEIVSSRMFSEALTQAGLPTTQDEAMDRYTGLSRADTLAKIAAHWGRTHPAGHCPAPLRSRHPCLCRRD